jgi:preprotein translocase subunit SecE
LDIRWVGRSRIRTMRKRVIVIVIAALAVLGLIATMLGGVPA